MYTNLANIHKFLNIGDQHNLNKLCDELVNMDITIEDILDEECNLVDSTTGSQSAGQAGLTDTASLAASTSLPIISASNPPEKKAKTVADAGITSKDTAGSMTSFVMSTSAICPAKKAKNCKTKSKKN